MSQTNTYSERVIKAGRGSYRRSRDGPASLAIAVLVNELHARNLIRRTNSRSHADLSRKRQSRARSHKGKLGIYGLDLIWLNWVREVNRRWHDVNHLLQDDFAAVVEHHWVRQSLDGDILINRENAGVRVTPIGLGDANRHRVRRIPQDIISRNTMVKFGLSLRTIIKKSIFILRRPWGNDQRELSRMHPANGVPTGRELNHLARVEAHACKLGNERLSRVLWHRHSRRPTLCGIDSARADRHNWPPARANSRIHGQGEEIRDGGAHRQEGLEEDEGGLEGGPDVLAAANLELEGGIESTDAVVGIRGGHIVESGADPFGGVDAAGGVGALVTGNHGVGEGPLAIACREEHDVLQLIDRGGPGLVRGEAWCEDRGCGEEGEGELHDGGDVIWR